MKLFVRILMLLMVVFSLSGCLGSGFGPQGGVYTMTKIGVYGTTPKGEKTGVACAHSVLWLASWGDGSIGAAAEEGGVTTINLVNLDSVSVLFGIYAHLCTEVRGD